MTEIDDDKSGEIEFDEFTALLQRAEGGCSQAQLPTDLLTDLLTNLSSNLLTYRAALRPTSRLRSHAPPPPNRRGRSPS